MSRLHAVFLDRDGTINVKAPEGAYITDPCQLQLLPGAADAISRLNRAGLGVAVVTNQRGIARRVMSERDLDLVHERLHVLLSAADAHLDAILYCPHDRDACDCRKPAPGLLLRAADRIGVADLGAAVMIGDSETDVVAGRAAGAATVLLSRCRPLRTVADRYAADLAGAIDGLLGPHQPLP